MRLYHQEEGIQLWLGDCREILPTLPRASAVITDPPYGVGLADWDEPPKQADLDMCRAAADAVIWFGAAPTKLIKHVLSLEPLAERIFIWYNPQTSHFFNMAFWTFQPIYLWGKLLNHIGNDVIAGTTLDDIGNVHPAQKPENLMRKFILGSVPEGGNLIDPWCGSGTTLRAAKDLHRKAIGIEINERYCEIAARRLSQEVLRF